MVEYWLVGEYEDFAGPSWEIIYKSKTKAGTDIYKKGLEKGQMFTSPVSRDYMKLKIITLK